MQNGKPKISKQILCLKINDKKTKKKKTRKMIYKIKIKIEKYFRNLFKKEEEEE